MVLLLCHSSVSFLLYLCVCFILLYVEFVFAFCVFHPFSPFVFWFFLTFFCTVSCSWSFSFSCILSIHLYSLFSLSLSLYPLLPPPPFFLKKYIILFFSPHHRCSSSSGSSKQLNSFLKSSYEQSFRPTNGESSIIVSISLYYYSL